METTESTEVSVIDAALEKENLTAKVLARIKNDYMPLKIASIDDVENIQKVTAAKKECADLRNLAVKICKHGREKAIKEQKDWIAKEKEVTGEITPVENHLKSELARIEAEKEHALFLHAQQGKLVIRKAKLETIGMSVPDEELLKLNDVDFISLFNDLHAKQLTEKETAIKAAQEKLDAEKAEADRKEAERVAEERRQTELKEAAECARVEAEAKAKAEAERKEREAAEAIEREKKLAAQARQETKIRERQMALVGYGLKMAQYGFISEDESIIVQHYEIEQCDETQFLEVLEKVYRQVEAANKFKAAEAEKVSREAAEALLKEKEARERAEREAFISGRVARLAAIGIHKTENGWYSDANKDVEFNQNAVELQDDDGFDKMLVDSQNTMYEMGIARKEHAERKAQEEREVMADRIAKLINAGFSFDGNYYFVGDFKRLDGATILGMTEREFYETIDAGMAEVTRLEEEKQRRHEAATKKAQEEAAEAAAKKEALLSDREKFTTMVGEVSRTIDRFSFASQDYRFLVIQLKRDIQTTVKNHMTQI